MRPFSKNRPARPRRRIRKLRLLALLTVLGLLGSVSFSFGLIRAIASEIGSGKLDPQKQLDKQVNGYIYDSSGKKILAVLRGSEARTLVDYDEIADPMRHAIVAIEDRRFWEHDGIDLRGIGRALVADIRQQKVVEGGSTITQQFVKNALDRDQKTIGRKVREAAFAWQLERDDDSWPKKRILQEYLNTIYFGNGAYGVQQAALVYFDHGAKDLTIAGGGAARRHPRRPEPLRPGREPGSRQGAARGPCSARCSRSRRSRPPSTPRRTRPPSPIRTRCGWAAPRDSTAPSTSSTTSSSS